MLKQIGARIRSERQRLGLSLEFLAKKIGISKMTLQRIETGVTSPSIITLTDISFHLKQPIESLIKEGEPNVILIKKAEQNTIFGPESGIRMLAPKGLITDRLTVTYAELEEKTVIEPHQNKGFEWAFMIEGLAMVRVGTKEYMIEEGDTIFYDAHFTHSICVYKKIRYVGLFLRDE